MPKARYSTSAATPRDGQRRFVVPSRCGMVIACSPVVTDHRRGVMCTIASHGSTVVTPRWTTAPCCAGATTPSSTPTAGRSPSTNANPRCADPTAASSPSPDCKPTRSGSLTTLPWRRVQRRTHLAHPMAWPETTARPASVGSSDARQRLEQATTRATRDADADADELGAEHRGPRPQLRSKERGRDGTARLRRTGRRRCLRRPGRRRGPKARRPPRRCAPPGRGNGGSQ